MIIQSEGNAGRVGVIAIVEGSPKDWVDSLRTLSKLRAHGVCDFRVAALDVVTLQRVCGDDPTITVAPQWNISESVDALLADKPELEAILIATAPVLVPPLLLEHALAWVREDPRIATVSFLSNAAGYLSFPYRNTPVAHLLQGHDEVTLTGRLRGIAPHAERVPLPICCGSVILVNRAVIGTVGGFDPALDARPRESIAELALRASRRGFFHQLDTGTFVTAQWFNGFPSIEACDESEARHRLHTLEPSFPWLYDAQKTALNSPLAIAMDVARSKVLGLRILIDGSCLGPMEMGTQVQTVELIKALVNRSDVSTVGIAVPHGKLPAYAAELLHSVKVRLYDAHDLQFEGADEADIIHRPFQPDRPIPWGRWRALAKRIVVTLQDLIAYKIGAYHMSGDGWLSYRQNIAEACKQADGIVAISDDTRASIQEERLNVAAERVFTIKNGSNHLGQQSAEETPFALVEREMVASRFILVLGATYAHKNRDLAILVWQELRRRGHKIALVMAGALVPKGSSQLDEARARKAGDDLLITMPDVSSGAKTWLLRHASVVLYPTSAEGFGLVPFEAAAMGTPTAYVSFGPLRELIDGDYLPREWSVTAMADYAEKLLTDRAAAEANIREILRRGTDLTWDITAKGLVDVYRTMLAHPSRA